MDKIGTVAEGFDFPVCNSFQAKVLDGQLCYEVDINEYYKNLTIDDLRTGLIFLMDYNEDRQVGGGKEDDDTSEEMSIHNYGKYILSLTMSFYNMCIYIYLQ